MSEAIFIRQEHLAQMQADVDSKAPEEACGLIAGVGRKSVQIIPITNTLHSCSAFRMDPQEELDAFYLAEKNGWDIIAVYHSHPQGISDPSQTDHEELSFPGIIYLIWYKLADTWQVRGFLMKSKTESSEIPVMITSD